MTIKQFTTSKTRLTVTIDKNRNDSYTAYEVRTRGNGGNTALLTSWSLDWLVDTLHMRYLPEKLEAVF
jgi:hypothetical protein